ncbi:MAG: DUF916 domain-containing protein [Thermoleophilia bacterium]|nr:DUF916 domain-containing protein [Thermoleophilia bacterium]
MPFSADPAPDSTSYKTGYFVINSSSGTTVTETLRLRNDSDAPIRLRIQSVDATTGPYGGISYGLPAEPVKNVGTWTSLPASEIDLAPRETKNVPLTVTVPPTASVGDHIGGIAVWLPRAENAGEPGAGGQSAVIDTQMRRVLSVHVVVPGPAEPLIVITDVKPVVRPDGVYLEILISNQGRRLTRGDGFIELTGNDFHRDFALDTFVPGTSIAYPIKWMDNPEENTYPNHILIQYDQFTAEWWGSFAVGSGLKAQEAEREGASGNSRYLFAGLLAAVLALIGLFTVLYLRKRRREEEKRLPPTISGSPL